MGWDLSLSLSLVAVTRDRLESDESIFRVSAARPSTMASNAQLEELNAQLMETKLSIEGLEKERDFYFGKLRDIEVLCQVFLSSEE